MHVYSRLAQRDLRDLHHPDQQDALRENSTGALDVRRLLICLV